jgi:hypothetical protein
MYVLHKYLHKIQKCSKNYNTNFGIFVLLKKGEVGLKSVFFSRLVLKRGFYCLVTQKFCVLHFQSITTIFHLVQIDYTR